MLYEVAIIRKPTKKESEEGTGDGVLLPPTPVVAGNENAAIAIVLRDNAEKIKSVDLNRAEILVRPFR